MSLQLLHHDILIDGTKVGGLGIIQQLQPNTASKLAHQ